MSNFLERLKSWLETVFEYSTPSSSIDNLYYVEGENIKIPFWAVEEIVNNYYGTKEYCEQIEEMLAERDDFVRLLRKENKELKAKNESSIN